MMNSVIREADVRDLGDIVQLLNATLGQTTHEYTERLHTVDGRSTWFAEQTARGFPVLVAVAGEGGSVGSVIGFATYGDFRDSVARPGFRFTVEHTVHVAASHAGRGVGRHLMLALMKRASAARVHTMIGAIDSSNTDSIRFHERLGFIEVGRLPEVGYKFDRWLDLVLMQRRVDSTRNRADGQSPDDPASPR